MTLAERKIRSYIVIEVPSIIDALKDFPDELVKTITFNKANNFLIQENRKRTKL